MNLQHKDLTPQKEDSDMNWARGVRIGDGSKGPAKTVWDHLTGTDLNQIA